jgi:hypothetical protein
VADEFGDFGGGQPRQPQPRHPRPALQVGKPPPGLLGEVLVPQRRDQQDPGLTQPDRQEREQFVRRLIGPVQVFQHEDQRCLAGQVGQQRQHPLEEAVACGGHVAGLVIGEQPCGPLSQRRHERPVGQRSPRQRRRLPDPDPAARRGHLPDQALRP